MNFSSPSQNQLNYQSYLNSVRGLYEKPIAQTSTALILTIFTISFFGIAAIKPTLATVSELIREKEEKEEINTKITQKITSLTAIQDDYLNNEETLLIFETAIPPEERFEKFLLEVEFLAQQTGTSITSINLSPITTFGDVRADASAKKVTKEAFSSFEVVVNTEATYDELKLFLDNVSELNRFVNIEKVAFSQPQDEKNPNLIRMATNLRLYFDSASPLNSVSK